MVKTINLYPPTLGNSLGSYTEIGSGLVGSIYMPSSLADCQSRMETIGGPTVSHSSSGLSLAVAANKTGNGKFDRIVFIEPASQVAEEQSDIKSYQKLQKIPRFILNPLGKRGAVLRLFSKEDFYKVPKKNDPLYKSFIESIREFGGINLVERLLDEYAYEDRTGNFAQNFEALKGNVGEIHIIYGDGSRFKEYIEKGLPEIGQVRHKINEARHLVPLEKPVEVKRILSDIFS